MFHLKHHLDVLMDVNKFIILSNESILPKLSNIENKWYELFICLFNCLFNNQCILAIETEVRANKLFVTRVCS